MAHWRIRRNGFPGCVAHKVDVRDECSPFRIKPVTAADTTTASTSTASTSTLAIDNLRATTTSMASNNSQ
uniref:Uncharacterized protein n=1 Tax=Oryza sativa subsp. japonica TaxID=39947 RepID=Q8H5X0_ORYSJ|nr:hypothetical protein [Oryza sativa Japonica Group]BAD30540.1 hypothetical protein [Oryza sativa Japonica Group]